MGAGSAHAECLLPRSPDAEPSPRPTTGKHSLVAAARPAGPLQRDSDGAGAAGPAHRTAAAEVTRYAGAADPSAPSSVPAPGRRTAGITPPRPVTTSPFELKRRAHPRTGAPDRRLKPAVCTCTPAFLRNYARFNRRQSGSNSQVKPGSSSIQKL